MAEEVGGKPLEEFMRNMQLGGLLELTGSKRKTVVIDLNNFNKLMKEVIKIVPRIEDELPGSRALASSSCANLQLCSELLQDIDMNHCYFDTKFDMCYCTKCHEKRGDGEYYNRGQPPCLYALPIGWCRFGLRTPPRTIKLQAFPKWHRAYHGTTLEAVTGILDVGNFVIPGDVTLGGKRTSQPDGHFTEDVKPEGFNEKQMFLSPSIKYSGHPAYAQVQRWERSNDECYDVQVALQVLVSPTSYTKGKETLLEKGDTTVFDEHFPNSEIEWSTEERGSTIPYGLLIRIVEQKKSEEKDPQ